VGNVTCASDSILLELHDQNASNEGSTGSYQVHASKLKDIISFVRMCYLFTYSVSQVTYLELLNIRAEHNFAGVAAWWQDNLPECFKELERKIQEALSRNEKEEFVTTLVLSLFKNILPKKF
jgi:hypothetical protein